MNRKINNKDDCTTCKWGKYNDHWDINFCYNPNNCKDFGLYEKNDKLTEVNPK